jgi:hypothetical protein
LELFQTITIPSSFIGNDNNGISTNGQHLMFSVYDSIEVHLQPQVQLQQSQLGESQTKRTSQNKQAKMKLTTTQVTLLFFIALVGFLSILLPSLTADGGVLAVSVAPTPPAPSRSPTTSNPSATPMTSKPSTTPTKSPSKAPTTSAPSKTPTIALASR